jgi:sulfide dehydrogenase cytochrome subunit
MRLRYILTFLACAPAGALAQGAEPALLAGACQGCHGVAGQGGHGIPQIKDTLSRAEFVRLMEAFRANQREATVMGRIARGYTDEQIAMLAAHYARAQ